MLCQSVLINLNLGVSLHHECIEKTIERLPLFCILARGGGDRRQLKFSRDDDFGRCRFTALTRINFRFRPVCDRAERSTVQDHLRLPIALPPA